MKYKDCGTVEVKKSFEVHLCDEYGESTEEKKTIQVGTKGEIVAYGWSSADGFRTQYDLEMQVGGEVEAISLYEHEVDQYMTVTPFPAEEVHPQ